MNCLEFHRAKLADPQRLPAAAIAHARGCPGCDAFARSVDESERELERALMVAVPEGLSDRAILRLRGAPRFSWRAWGLAASLALAALGGASLYVGVYQTTDQYARLALEHVAHEPESFTELKRPDSDAFRTVVHNFGGSLVASLGDIRYMKLCPVDEGIGWHVVFETPEGLATLILVPGKKLGAAQSATVDGWSALARPARRGYYVIVTPSADATDRIDRMVRERVNWDA